MPAPMCLRIPATSATTAPKQKKTAAKMDNANLATVCQLPVDELVSLPVNGDDLVSPLGIEPRTYGLKG